MPPKRTAAAVERGAGGGASGGVESRSLDTGTLDGIECVAEDTLLRMAAAPSMALLRRWSHSPALITETSLRLRHRRSSLPAGPDRSSYPAGKRTGLG